MEADRGHAESEGGLGVTKRMVKSRLYFFAPMRRSTFAGWIVVTRALLVPILLEFLIATHVAFAQVAPSGSDLAAYRGLHAAAESGEEVVIHLAHPRESGDPERLV
jgi:hypothetical protein